MNCPYYYKIDGAFSVFILWVVIAPDLAESLMNEHRTLKLQELMHKVGINSFRQLSKSIGCSDRTIRKLRSGELDPLRWQTIVQISSVLQLPVTELIETFSSQSFPKSPRQEIETLQQEYQHLRQQLQQQRETLQAEFQYQSLQTLESFLTYFPAAKYAAAKNPDFPASKIFPLVQSLDRLIQKWGVSVIGEIGAEISYDPRWHQLIEGTANPNDLVTVRYVGYRQDETLIFRAKVSELINS